MCSMTIVFSEGQDHQMTHVSTHMIVQTYVYSLGKMCMRACRERENTTKLKHINAQGLAGTTPHVVCCW